MNNRCDAVIAVFPASSNRFQIVALGIHNFGVNSHLVILEVWPVGAYTSMYELHPLVGKSVRYGG